MAAVATAALMLFAAADSALAADSRPPQFFADEPKGLEEHYTAWKFNYVGEILGDLSGGIRTGAIYEGYAKVGLAVNLEKLVGWKNTAFYVNALYPHGESLSLNYVGDLNVVSNIDAYDSLRLFKCFLQTNFPAANLTVRVGVMAVDKDFFISEAAALFLNSGFGAFPVIGQDLVAPIYPVSAPGVRLVWKPSDKIALRGAVFSGDVGSQTSNKDGTRWNFSGHNGVSTFVEASYKPTIGGGLEGTYTLGGFYDSKSFTRLRDGRSAHGNYGVYAIADQQIWRAPGRGDGSNQGAAVFARVAVAPSDRNLVNYDFETGINYTGLVPGRNADVIGAAFLYSRISDGVPRDAVGFPPDHEAVFELTYQAPVTEWFTVQPDLQYVSRPAGISGARDAVVAGMRFSVAF